LWLNFLNCFLFFIAFYLAHQYSAAEVDLLACMTSLIQAFLSRLHESAWRITLTKNLISVLFIAIFVYLVPPEFTLFSMLPFILYAWTRVAETLEHNLMRVMMLTSESVWLVVAFQCRSYGTFVAGCFIMMVSIKFIHERMAATSELKLAELSKLRQ
jgi:hypothetical protein